MAIKLSEASVTQIEEELDRAIKHSEIHEEPYVSQEIVNDNGIGVSQEELSSEIEKRTNSVEEVPYMEVTVEEPTIEMAIDPVEQNYSNSGYGKNAYGQYFNPNVDEYDETYDPHNDQLFNPEVNKQEETPVKSAEELLTEYIQIVNSMGVILNKKAYPGIENEDINTISYQLDDNEKDRFNELKDRLSEINKQNTSVADMYVNKVNRIQEIRNEMGSILNKEAYPGIENENIHDISNQLDDNFVARFNELNNELNIVKSEQPDLFNGVEQVKATTQEQVVPEKVDDNPQHEANPETGYAVGGFQSPAIVPIQEQSLDDNLQHIANPETGYAVDGFQSPAVIQEPQEVKQGPTETELKEQKRKELLKKALIASAGFATGLGLSCVPGVGTIRMGVAAVKLTGTAVNVWANKHPDGKVAHVRDSAILFAENKIPRITSGIRYINDKMKQTPVNVFINGMAAGYITGNIFEMVTGNTVFEAIKNRIGDTPNLPVQDNLVSQVHPQDPNVPQGDTGIPQEAINPTDGISTPAADVIQEAANTFDPSAATEAIKGGATIDLSGISQGLVSSDAAQGVNLITQAGKDVSFLREVTLSDGTVMWAFNQSNGLGYAWFKAEDVLNELARTGQDLASVAGRSM